MSFSLKQALSVVVVLAISILVIGANIALTDKNNNSTVQKNNELWDSLQDDHGEVLDAQEIGTPVKSDVKLTFYEDGYLSISGNGEMTSSWLSQYKSLTKKLVIEGNVKPNVMSFF